jgi:hypothetical protein
VERKRRRVLLLFSNVTVAVCHLLLVVHFYLIQKGGDLRNFGWLPLLCFAIFIAGFNIGFGPLTWVIMVELLSNEWKSWASGLARSVSWILVFSVTNLYGMMIEKLGQMITFGIFGGMCIFGSVIIVFIVPESTWKTREKTQLELRITCRAFN